MKEIKFQLTRLFSNHIKSNVSDHYKLLGITQEYKQIGKNYFNKYSKATGWTNLNKELFESNKQAEIDYNVVSIRQAQIQKEFFDNLEMICNSPSNKDCKICSNEFKEFYVNAKYHYGQNIDDIIKTITFDIKNMEK